MLAPVTVAILITSVTTATRQQRGVESPAAASLERSVHEARLAQKLPGLAVVIVRSDGQPRVYVSGERVGPPSRMLET